MCHKKNGKMFGAHSTNSLELRCQNCHGEKEGHPRKKSNLIKFDESSVNTAEQQTAVCTKCHNPNDLAEGDWTHVVHSNKVNCANCHQLHTETDPVTAISTSERSKLCVNCHESR
ncbi:MULTISPECIES: cytochrome c3 family protein [Shewanella]|nr:MULTISPECIES: cytochrome c3 family protein [Shewanella]